MVYVSVATPFSSSTVRRSLLRHVKQRRRYRYFDIHGQHRSKRCRHLPLRRGQTRARLPRQHVHLNGNPLLDRLGYRHKRVSGRRWRPLPSSASSDPGRHQFNFMPDIVRTVQDRDILKLGDDIRLHKLHLRQLRGRNFLASSLQALRPRKVLRRNRAAELRTMPHSHVHGREWKDSVQKLRK
jgi:hypothetical protein